MTPARPIAKPRGGLRLLQVWIFVFVAVAGTTILASHPPLRTAAVVVYAVPVIGWAILTVRGPWTLLDVAILAGMALHVLASFMGADPTASLESTGTVAAFAAVFWLARSVARRPRVQAAVASAVGIALGFWVAIISVTWVMEKLADIELLGWPPRLGAYQPYVWGSINSPPVLLLLAIPVLAFMTPGRLRTILFLVVAASSIVIIPFSVGRAAWLGIAVALLTAEWLLGFPTLRRVFDRRAMQTVALGAGAAVVAAIAFLLVTRLDAVAQALDSRIRLWDQALGMFGADPLAGSGPMTFAWARLQHVPDYVDRVAAGAAHNVAMQTLAEGGLLLAAALALVVGAWVREVAKASRRLTSAQRIAVAALVGYATVTLLDDLSFLPAITVLLVVLAAWALPATAEHAARPALRTLVTPTVLALAVVASLPSVLDMTLMRFEAASAREAALSGDWQAARSGFERATELQPASALHWLSLGLAEFRIGNDDAARQAYERARLANPGDPRSWGALAALEPDADAGLRLLEEAARRSNDPQYAWRLGVSGAASGSAATAADALALATIYEPNLVPDAVAADPSVTPPAIEEAGRVVGTLAEIPPAVARWNADLLLDRASADAPAAWLVALRVDAADAHGAAEMLDVALRVAPHDPRSHAAAGAVAHLTCDEATYREALRRAGMLGAEEEPIGQPVAERRIGIYGIPDLGDYQPIDHDELPVAPMWPTGLIEVPDCGW